MSTTALHNASSLRKQGPITTSVNCSRITYPQSLADRPRRMGSCFRRNDKLKECNASSLPRRDGWGEDGFEMLGAVAVGVSEKFVGDAAQPSAQFGGHADGVELGTLAH